MISPLFKIGAFETCAFSLKLGNVVSFNHKFAFAITGIKFNAEKQFAKLEYLSISNEEHLLLVVLLKTGEETLLAFNSNAGPGKDKKRKTSIQVFGTSAKGLLVCFRPFNIE